MATISTFTQDGLLPPGDYPLTLEELYSFYLVKGPGDSYPNWDHTWRKKLVDNLSILVNQLWQIEITEIFIDGSFIEDKDHPKDLEGYFVCAFEDLISGKLEQDLNLLDPFKIWTWDPASRRPYHGYPKPQLLMWHRYRVELYPHFGQSSGIRDEFGNELEFPAAFRRSRRENKLRGIIQIARKT